MLNELRFSCYMFWMSGFLSIRLVETQLSNPKDPITSLRSRFNLGSQGLTTFHMWWSRFPTLDGDISQWHAWGPISPLNRLLTPLKPHAHTLMYKSAAASVSCEPSDLVPTEHEPSKGGLGVLRTLGIQSGDERQKGDFKTSIYFGQTSWSSYSVSRKPWLFKAFHVAFSNSMSAKMMLESEGWQIEAWANQSLTADDWWWL